MPCRDYMDDVPSINVQQKLDMLSRIACKALTHIEESGDGLEMLILKDPEIADWWSAHKEADRREKERLAEEKRERRLRKTALSKLTDEEKDILGIK